MFLNFTNHRLESWTEDQIEKAEVYGKIEEMPFPNVSSYANKADVETLAKEYAEKIIALKPNAVLAQGEMTLCFAIVRLLKMNGIKVVCATSERVSVEKIDENGAIIKTSQFNFVQFREY